jgi:N-acetylhexosamine 1-kinase
VEFNEIISRFDFDGQFVGIEPYGMGLINNTYAVSVKRENGEIKRYILQKINKNTFKQVDKLMRNIRLVTEYLKDISVKNGGNWEREVLTLVKTLDGNSYYMDKSGEYWRAYVLIENTIGYAIAESRDMFEDAGRAFGTFVRNLSGFPAEELYEVIANFHNTESRFSDFKKALENNYENRKDNVKDEIEFVLSREKYASKVVSKLKSGEIPLRVTHNDTKLNNVLMDVDTNRAVCVIDLDTIMPGSLLYDFGDAIRSGCNTGLEDEKDLSKVSFDVDLFESFSKGFLEGIGDNITKEEMELLPFAGILMTYECGMRFLGDYLNGDVYFKTQYPEHNLVRCRTQFKLVRDMEERLGEMSEIVSRYAKI